MTIKQLSVFVENRTGRIHDVAQILGANGINMTAFCLAESPEFGILRMIVSDVEAAARALKAAHFGVTLSEVVCFSCPNQPGALANVLGCLAQEEVFIEYMYAFSHADRAKVIIRPTDLARCVEIMGRCDCQLYSDIALCK